MKRKSTLYWLKLSSLLIAVLIFVGMNITACGSNEGGGKSANGAEWLQPQPLPDPGPNEARVNVSIPLNLCPTGSCLVTPGVPPGTIGTFGSIENRICTSPYPPTPPATSCVVDRSAQVVAGTLTVSYNVPMGVDLEMGYALNNTLMFQNISINGTPINNYGTLGTAPSQWGVTCFRVDKTPAGVITATGNPVCSAIGYQVRYWTRGDENLNGTYENPYDDPIATLGLTFPYSGNVAEGPIKFQTSLWQNPTPGGVWQNLVWNAATTSYDQITYMLSTMGAWGTTHHPMRGPFPPPGSYEANLNVYADATPLAGGPMCRQEVVHFYDFTPPPAATRFYGWSVIGVNTATGCVTPGTNTMATIVGGP